jgi:glycosyltransferase involved in cell wall biosynthesis
MADGEGILMRIAYVCMDSGIPVYGRKGASVHVQGVIAAMLRAGHHVTLFCTRIGDDAPAFAHEVVLHQVRVPAADATQGSDESVRSISAALQCAISSHDAFDAVYERYSLWSIGGMEYALRHHIPGILEVNAPLIDEQAAHRSLNDRDAAQRAAIQLFREASTIIAVSHEVAGYVNGFRDRRTDAVVEANGFEPLRFPSPAPTLSAPFTLGFLGTLKPWHGIDILASVFTEVRDRIPDARLLVIGDGPARESLCTTMQMIDAGDAFELAGAVAPEEVGPWLARMDVALAPYPGDAPFYFSPLKIVEYMAAGVPVVASDIGQIPSLVQHEATGLLVPPGDVRLCVDACMRLYRDPVLRRRLGSAARADAMSTRTWDAVVARILTRAYDALAAQQVLA